jgi:hypothetical protein
MTCALLKPEALCVTSSQDVQRAHQRGHCVRRAARGKDQLGQAHAQRQEGNVETHTGVLCLESVPVVESAKQSRGLGLCLAQTDVQPLNVSLTLRTKQPSVTRLS